MKHQEFRWAWLALLSAAVATGCGGGSSTQSTPAPSPAPGDRAAAAAATANDNADCKQVQPFYWEIGDATHRQLASGQAGGTTYGAGTALEVASASKWIYASYVAEEHHGVNSEDVPFLNFTSGYDKMGNGSACATFGGLLDPTVNDCLALGSNGDKNTDDEGKFAYDSGHMENHAALLMNLGSADSAALASKVGGALNISLAYAQPLIAGGVRITTDEYASFLQKILAGNLEMHDLLGTHAVCANPDVCPSAAVTGSPVQGTGEDWKYSIGHWVEPDGSFSSAGAFGYYPWIDKNKQYYGILARHAQSLSEQEGLASAMCGRQIRLAWATGQAQ